MAGGSGFLVSEQFALPKVPDDIRDRVAARKYLVDLNRELINLISQYSAAINLFLLQKNGDQVNGKLTFNPATGTIVIPVYTADPGSLTNGQIWYNSTSNTFKCYQNGAVKTFTVF